MAFNVGNLRFYECKQVPFGLCNAPATFQQLMQNCLGELNLTYCIIYLDDIIVYLKMESEHLQHLCTVFNQFCENNLKLKPSKCNHFHQEITYLAHHISWAGVKPSKENVQAIIDFPPPKMYSKIQAFLGLTGHYRWFIKNFAHLAGPLHKYLCNEGATQKSEGLHFSVDARLAFKKIKKKLINTPVLAFADYTEPFCLETDALKEGLGAVFSQKKSDGKYHPIAFASQTLNNHEENYHSSKLEFLALKWAITEHFKVYLMHGKFTVCMDNNPLMYILTTPSLDATSHHWVGALASYNFDLEYLKGAENGATNALSQVPVPQRQGASESDLLDDDSENEEVAGPGHESYSSKDPKEGLSHWDGKVVKTVLEGAQARTQSHANRPQECLENESSAQAKVISVCKSKMHVTHWVKVQSKDHYIPIVMRLIEDKKKNKLCEMLGDLSTTSEGKSYLAKWKGFCLQKRMLYLCTKLRGDTEDINVFVVPIEHWICTLNRCHWDVGHQGQTHTLALLEERFWWPGMSRQSHKMVQGCEWCKLFEGAQVKALLQTIWATAPLELLHVNFSSLEKDIDPKKPTTSLNVLMVMDHFTRYSMAFCCPDQKANTVAKILYDWFILVFGAPLWIHSDWGANFRSQLVKELCNMFGIDRTGIMAFHPKGNGRQPTRTAPSL